MRIRIVTIVGLAMGTIILVRYLKSDAPSICEARYNSSGICAKFSFKRYKKKIEDTDGRTSPIRVFLKSKLVMVTKFVMITS